MYDLHLHSTYSDGVVNLREICTSAVKIGLKGISLTDHDTVEGLEEMRKLTQEYRLNFIPGIEFGITYKQKECHILGYYIDNKDKDLLQMIQKAALDRNVRTKKMIKKLCDLSVKISMDDIIKIAGKNNPSRSHIAKYLVEHGYAKNMDQAFKNYLNPEGIAYVPKLYADAHSIIRVIKKSGGIAILAHPVTLESDQLILELIECGIDGIEVINSKHTVQDISRFLDIADQFKLIYTCGSDCHGRLISNKKYIGNYTISDKQIKRMYLIHETRLKNAFKKD